MESIYIMVPFSGKLVLSGKVLDLIFVLAHTVAVCLSVQSGTSQLLTSIPSLTAESYHYESC